MIWLRGGAAMAKPVPTFARGGIRLLDKCRGRVEDNNGCRPNQAVGSERARFASERRPRGKADFRSRILERPRAAGAPPDALDPPFRGKGRPDVRHGAHRRILSPLYRARG